MVSDRGVFGPGFISRIAGSTTVYIFLIVFTALIIFSDTGKIQMNHALLSGRYNWIGGKMGNSMGYHLHFDVCKKFFYKSRYSFDSF